MVSSERVSMKMKSTSPTIPRVMSQPPPLIAVCARVLTFSDEGKRDAFSSSQPYSRAVARAGGVPVLVPPIHELSTNALTRAAALRRRAPPRRRRRRPALLRPGADRGVAATASSRPTTSSTWQWPVPRWSSTCRCWRCAAGCRCSTSCSGGTLVQDIGNDEHWMREHSVKLVEGSIVADLVGDTHLDHCHSVHHQGIGELGRGLVPIGYAEDGQLEAVELPTQVVGRRAAMAPRGHRRRQPQQQAIYDELVRRGLGRAAVNPLVVIVGRQSHEAQGVRGEPFAAGQAYFRAVERAGGTPLMLPPISGLIDDIPDLLGRVDAVVFHGGGDIDPRRYGQDGHRGIVVRHRSRARRDGAGDDRRGHRRRQAGARDLPRDAGAQRRPRRHAGARHRQRGPLAPLHRRRARCRIARGQGNGHGVSGERAIACTIKHSIDWATGCGSSAAMPTASSTPSSSTAHAGSSPPSGTPRIPPPTTRSSKACSTNWSAKPA